MSVEVLVEIKGIDQTFTYAVPVNLEKDIKIAILKEKSPGISELTEAHYLKQITIQTFYMRNQLKEMRIFTF